MVLKLHWFKLMCHNGLPHLAHSVECVKVRAKTAQEHMRDSLRRDALAAKALDHKMTQLYILREPETDAMDLLRHHRRYMNG